MGLMKNLKIRKESGEYIPYLHWLKKQEAQRREQDKLKHKHDSTKVFVDV